MAKPHRLLFLLLAACSGDAAKTEAPPAPTEAAPEVPAEAAVVAKAGSGPSLLLVTMDTTRADRIGAYGYADAHTPHIDKVAAEGVRFSRAYATVPLTTPSHASMLTGLYPTRHGVHNNGDAVLPDELTTLAELLVGRGYHTAGSVSAFVTTRVWNLDQGFDAYFDTVQTHEGGRADSRWGRERSAAEVVDDLAGWLKEKPAGAPFFTWAHMYDPHDPYAPPKEWAEKMPGRPYDGEIAYMDEQIGRLIAAAEAAAGPEGVAIVLVADHGEAFNNEHGEQSHGMYTFDPTMRIPFIVRPPKPLAQGREVSEITVSNVDVTPTALGLLGMPSPEDLDGADLSVFSRGETRDREPVFLEAETPWNRFGFHPEWTAAQGPWKLMATPNPRLFDVDADPKELTNRYAEQGEVAGKLKAFVDGVQARRVNSETMSASPEMIEQLAALGYVAGTDAGPADVAGLPDAKDQQQVINRIEAARRLTRQPNKTKEAEAAMRGILRDFPMMGEMRMSLSRVLQRQGKFAQAEKVLKEGVELQPASTLMRSHLAGVIARQGRLQEAYDLVRTIYEQVPGDDLSRISMLRYLTDMNRVDEALALGQQWLATEPENRGLQSMVGILLVHKRDLRGAEPLLQASLLDGQPREQVHRALGMIALAKGDTEGLIGHLQAESADFPSNLGVRMELGNTFMTARRWDEAAAEYAAIAEQNPKDFNARRAWAQAVFNSGDYELAAKLLAPALAGAPDNPEVLLLHANLLDKQGKTEEAKAAAEEAKALWAAGRAAEEAEPPAAVHRDRGGPRASGPRPARHHQPLIGGAPLRGSAPIGEARPRRGAGLVVRPPQREGPGDSIHHSMWAQTP